MIYLGGELVSVDGTSASTPVIAAMIALINDARIKIGMSPMGFLNPWLYATAAKFPSAFVDITQGDNNCTANAQICCPFGLPATPGWDASTGLGTPNFLKYDFFFFQHRTDVICTISSLRNVALNPHQPLPDSQYIEFPKLINHGEKVVRRKKKIHFISSASHTQFIMVILIVLGVVNVVAVGLMLWNWSAAHRRREEYTQIS